MIIIIINTETLALVLFTLRENSLAWAVSWLCFLHLIERERERLGGVEVTVNGGINMGAWFQAICEGLLDRIVSNTIQFFLLLNIVNANN